MPNSSSVKRSWIVIGMKIVVFLLLTGLMIYGLTRLVITKKSAIAEYYGGGAASDVILLGTSSVLRISPMLIDEASGFDTYNLASNAQSLAASKMILKECIARGVKPDVVILNLQERSVNREPATNDYGILRNLTGFRKLQMVANYKLDDYPEALLPCIYYRDRLFDRIDGMFGWDNSGKTDTDSEDTSASAGNLFRNGGLFTLAAIRSRLGSFSPAYRFFPLSMSKLSVHSLLFTGDRESVSEETEPDPHDPKAVKERLARDARAIEAYFGKGFSSKETTYMDLSDLNLGIRDSFVAKDLDPRNLSHMLDIFRICRDNGIELILCTIPSLPAYQLSIEGEGHDSFHKYFAALAEQNSVPYWDLTYIRPEVLEVDSTLFSSARHGNASYTLRVSPLIGQMLREYMDGTLDLNRYLFDDYEKYMLLHPGIYRLSSTKINVSKTGEQYIVVTAVSDGDSALEYRVTWLKGDGSEVLLSPWGEDNRIVIGTDLSPGQYTLRIDVRKVEDPATEGHYVNTLPLAG